MSAMNGVCARSAPGQTVVTAGAGVYTRTHAETDAQPALRRQRRRYTQTTCIQVCVRARTHTHTQKQTGGGSHSQREGLADGAERALRLTPALSPPQPLVTFLLP